MLHVALLRSTAEAMTVFAEIVLMLGREAKAQTNVVETHSLARQVWRITRRRFRRMNR